MSILDRFSYERVHRDGSKQTTRSTTRPDIDGWESLTMTMLMDNSIFSSVFPAAAALDHTTPTPVATPDLGFAGVGTSFGTLTSPNKHGHSQSMSVAQLHVKRNIAWSTATRFLSLNALVGDELNAACKHGRPQKKKSREAEEAIDFLLSGNGPYGETDADWNLVSKGTKRHSQQSRLIEADRMVHSRSQKSFP